VQARQGHRALYSSGECRRDIDRARGDVGLSSPERDRQGRRRGHAPMSPMRQLDVRPLEEVAVAIQRWGTYEEAPAARKRAKSSRADGACSMWAYPIAPSPRCRSLAR
jgi:hypothetical protein